MGSKFVVRTGPGNLSGSSLISCASPRWPRERFQSFGSPSKAADGSRGGDPVFRADKTAPWTISVTTSASKTLNINPIAAWYCSAAPTPSNRFSKSSEKSLPSAATLSRIRSMKPATGGTPCPPSHENGAPTKKLAGLPVVRFNFSFKAEISWISGVIGRQCSRHRAW